jgi:hypothetical protein
VAKAKSSKKGLLGFEGDTSFQAQSQTKAGIAVDFDMVALGLLGYSIYTLGPNQAVDAFTGFWGDLFGSVASGFGEALPIPEQGWLRKMLGLEG